MSFLRVEAEKIGTIWLCPVAGPFHILLTEADAPLRLSNCIEHPATSTDTHTTIAEAHSLAANIFEALERSNALPAHTEIRVIYSLP